MVYVREIKPFALKENKYVVYGNQRKATLETLNKIQLHISFMSISLSSAQARCFSDSYTPKTIINRDAEKLAIAEYLKGVMRKAAFKTLYIYGPPGVGKTTVARSVLMQFEGADPKAVVIYLDCTNLTRYQVLRELSNMVCGRMEKKSSCSELIERITGRLRSKKRTLIITLDNFDKIKGVEELLWDFQGIMERTLKPIGLILISTDRHDLTRLVSSRLYSRLRAEPLYFKPYSADMIFHILKERMLEAYGRHIAKTSALMEIAWHVEDNGGSARQALEIFMKAVEAAERNRHDLITPETVREVLRIEENEKLRERLKLLKEKKTGAFETLRAIVELTGMKKSIYTGMLERYIRSKGARISRRAVEYHLKELEAMKLIKLRKVRKGRGISTDIRLNIPRETILQI